MLNPIAAIFIATAGGLVGGVIAQTVSDVPDIELGGAAGGFILTLSLLTLATLSVGRKTR